MARKQGGRTGLISALALVAVVGIVGCGGGGASSKGIVVGGTNGGSGGTGTTGEITTGGTTGVEVTNGGGFSTTGADPDGAAGGVITTGSLTTGTTGSEAATGGTTATGTSATTGEGTTTTGASTTGTSSTTGSMGAGTTGTTDSGAVGTTGSGASGTTGSNTTGTTGGDATGTSSTTGSGSTGDGSTGGTDGGSAGGGGGTTIGRRANAIYFGHYGDTSLISSVMGDGTNRQDENGADADVVAAVPDVSGSYVYAKSVDGRIGVYRGTSYDASRSTVLAAPAFDGVSTLQTTASGAVMMVASGGGSTMLYLIAGGNVTALDDAQDAAITVDGSKIAYTKSNGASSDLYLWDVASGTSTIIETGGDSVMPSFSKDGAWILFSSTRDQVSDNGYDLYQIPTAGGDIQRITNTPNISELGACYNESRTMISCVGMSTDFSLAGLYVLSNAGGTRIAADSDLNLGTYWTDSQGRSLGRRSVGRYQRLHRRKR